MFYELVIIWESGDKEITVYDSIERAEKAGQNMKMAFGKQISWYCTREKKHSFLH